MTSLDERTGSPGAAPPAAPTFIRNKRSGSCAWFRQTGWRHIFAVAALAFALFPIIWVISAAFSDGNLNSQQLIPENPTPRQLPRADDRRWPPARSGSGSTTRCSSA